MVAKAIIHQGKFLPEHMKNRYYYDHKEQDFIVKTLTCVLPVLGTILKV